MTNRGARLIEAMKLRGMHKQHALAYTLGVNESTVTRWKNNGPMSLDSAVALCAALNVSLDWFVVGYGHMDRDLSKHSPAKSYIAPEKIDEQLLDAFRKVEATMSASSKTFLISFINSIVSR